MHGLLQDLRYGARTLLKQPGFTSIAVLTLALGIGANTAIFSVVHAVLLRPLPFPEAERMVAIQELGPDGKRRQATPANFLDWRAQSTVFEQIAAIHEREANLTGEGGEPERIRLAVASAAFFDVLGVRPVRGRLFQPADEAAGHAPVIVLGHGLWRRRFGEDPEIVGGTVALNGQSYTVIGIAPPGMDYPREREAWVPPLRLAPELNNEMNVAETRGLGYLSVIARLKPGVGVAQAHAEMETLTARLRQQYPETNSNRFNRVVSLHTHLVGDIRPVLWLLLGAVGCVLLIACANVANLMLVRAAGRQKELAVRAALGAGRRRLMRQLLTESVLLAACGGGLGLLFAWWGLEGLIALSPGDIPRLREIGLDGQALGFTLGISVVTGIAFGLAPAWQVSNLALSESLKEEGRGVMGGVRRSRLRNSLVVAEVALSLVLLVGAGLLFRSLVQLQRVSPGFDPQQVLTLRLAPSGDRYRDDPQFAAYFERVIANLSAVPGVETVGAINTLPLAPGAVTGFFIEGEPARPASQWHAANFRIASPDYFRALGIPLLRGRDFAAGDIEGRPNVAIINQALAGRGFAGENPIGRRISFGGTNDGRPVWFEIIGVAANTRTQRLDAEPTPDIYTTYLQTAPAAMSMVVRTAAEPAVVAASVRRAALSVDGAQPVTEFRALEQLVYESIAQPRFNTVLFLGFAGLALLLAVAGIYGVMAYGVTQRRHEIGVRMALGARANDVLRMVIGQGMTLTLIGVAIGLAGAFVLTRWMKAMLFEVSATDPLTFGVIAVLLTGVALLACYMPALRATKVDPLIALRYE